MEWLVPAGAQLRNNRTVLHIPSRDAMIVARPKSSGNCFSSFFDLGRLFWVKAFVSSVHESISDMDPIRCD